MYLTLIIEIKTHSKKNSRFLNRWPFVFNNDNIFKIKKFCYYILKQINEYIQCEKLLDLVKSVTLHVSIFQNVYVILPTSSGWLLSRATNSSIHLSSWNRATFSGLMAHFQIAPVAAANSSLLSMLLSRPTKGSRPPFWRTISRVSFSSAHWKKKDSRS